MPWRYRVCFKTLRWLAAGMAKTAEERRASRPRNLLAPHLPDDGALQLPSPAALAAAASCVERLVAQRLRELMLLSDWPCVCARRTQLQLDRLYEQGERHGAYAGAARACMHARASQ